MEYNIYDPAIFRAFLLHLRIGGQSVFSSNGVGYYVGYHGPWMTVVDNATERLLIIDPKTESLVELAMVDRGLGEVVMFDGHEDSPIHDIFDWVMMRGDMDKIKLDNLLNRVAVRVLGYTDGVESKYTPTHITIKADDWRADLCKANGLVATKEVSCYDLVWSKLFDMTFKRKES